MKIQHALVASLATLAFAVTATAKDLSVDEVATLTKEGKILPTEKLDAAALAAHPGGKIEQGAEIERHHRGYVYEVEVTDAKGQEWDLDIDATTGKIVKNERD